MVGSEFVQKYLGEGPRMVRDVFRLARENAPSIVFIDEVDSIATKRFDAQTGTELDFEIFIVWILIVWIEFMTLGADREVQRILLELLNQMDGFDQSTNVKVIMATNRADTLDPALLRPGRLDRKIEFPLPDRRQKRMIYQACTAMMNLGMLVYVLIHVLDDSVLNTKLTDSIENRRRSGFGRLCQSTGKNLFGRYCVDLPRSRIAGRA